MATEPSSRWWFSRMRDDRAPHGHGRAVERVQRLGAGLAAHPRAQAPRLVVGAVGAGGQLAVARPARAARPRRSNLRAAEAPRSPTGDVHHPVGDLERLQDRLLPGQDAPVLGRGVLGQHEREHLHLVELVHPEDAPRVLAGGARLAPEAGGDAHVAQGQVGRGQDLVGVQPGQRHLGGADQVEVVLGRAVDRGPVGGEEAGPEHRLLAHQHRRHDRREALGLQQVHGERDQRQLQPHQRAHAGRRSARPRRARPRSRSRPPSGRRQLHVVARRERRTRAARPPGGSRPRRPPRRRAPPASGRLGRATSSASRARLELAQLGLLARQLLAEAPGLGLRGRAVAAGSAGVAPTCLADPARAPRAATSTRGAQPPGPRRRGRAGRRPGPPRRGGRGRPARAPARRGSA